MAKCALQKTLGRLRRDLVQKSYEERLPAMWDSALMSQKTQDPLN